MNDTITPVESASALRQGFAATKASIEADGSLSDEGKAAAIAKASEVTNAEIAKLRGAVEASTASEKSSLELRLLSCPSPSLGSATDKIAHTASYRDAIGRARMTTTPAELLDLQRSALLTGDQLLARATMVVGLDRGDADVVNGWSKANPRLESDVDRLWELTHGGQSATQALRNTIATELAFGKV